VGLVIYAGNISRCMKRECYERFRKWKFESHNSRGVSIRLKGKI